MDTYLLSMIQAKMMSPFATYPLPLPTSYPLLPRYMSTHLIGYFAPVPATLV